MDYNAVHYLNKALDFEEAGFFVEALKLMDRVLGVFQDDKEELLLEKAKMEFRNGYHREALSDFISVYEITKNNDLYELILEAYYLPNEVQLRETFRNNMQYLKAYPYYRNQEEYRDDYLEVVPIWQDEKCLYCVNKREKSFRNYIRTNKGINGETNLSVMVVNELWIEDIFFLEETFRIEEVYVDEELPLYLVYDVEFWMLFAQSFDLRELLGQNRIVFLVGEKSFYEYLKDDKAILPRKCFGNNSGKTYIRLVQQINAECQKEARNKMEKVEAYYKLNVQYIDWRIKSRRPRILFYTSRFTTALQYHARACMRAAQRLGCETKLLIESDRLHRIFFHTEIFVFEQFRPDMIFMLDHFRFEYDVIPNEVVCITWIQDFMPRILDKNTPLKLTKRDFVLNHFTTWREFKEIGYQEKCLVEAPIPADSHIYRPYELTAEEAENYACEICFVCHASDVDSHIQIITQNLPEGVKEAICFVYKEYQCYVYETGDFFYTKESFSEYIKGLLASQYGFALKTDTLEHFAKDMFENYNQRVYRQVLVDWMLDAGFNNIKLWGNGWVAEEKYKAYAMGPAENGEMLSKIYQASKIVIGNNVMTTSAARAWETMLSGGFYMSNYIPEKEDITDIRKIVEVGKDVVMFYNKKDLIEKLHYYLSHEEERKEMANRGREAALAHMTFDILMEKVLREVAERLEGNENGR